MPHQASLANSFVAFLRSVNALDTSFTVKHACVAIHKLRMMMRGMINAAVDDIRVPVKYQFLSPILGKIDVATYKITKENRARRLVDSADAAAPIPAPQAPEIFSTG